MLIYWNEEDARMEWAEETPVYPFGPQLPKPEPEEEPVVEEEDTVALHEQTDIELIAGDPVLTWRAKRLVDNGMLPAQARSLAIDRGVDITWVVNRLLKRGCDPNTAFDIASGVMAT